MNELAKKILKFKSNTNIQIGLDIGGTLTKMAIYLSKTMPYKKNEFFKEFECNDHIELDNDHLFIKQFQTNKFNPEAIEFLKKLKTIYPIKNLYATGGGSYKFNNLVNETLNINMVKHDELISLVNGYLIMNELNTFYEKSNDEYKFVGSNDLEFPHISVNIGSGVSILRVDSGNDIKRITGTLMGGGTLIGLSKLMINVDNYTDILKLAEQGDNKNVDLLVGDIYGGSASNINLDREVIASSFGKINDLIHQNRLDTLRIYYFGNFTKKNSYAIEVLNNATKFWNKDLNVRFNKFDGYLGSIGTLID